MSTPRLIGIAGKARSGKDTVANFIEDHCAEHGLTFAREAFARRLKESAAHALGIFENELEFCDKLKGDYERGSIEVRMATPGGGPNQVVTRITGREYLQYYGTEAHREVFSKDFWVDAVLPEAVHIDGTQEWWWNFKWENDEGTVGGHPADVCVITDVRFDNEAQRIKDLGGEVWQIVRQGSGAGNHASEQELPAELIDFVIDNNGTYDTLKSSIYYVLEETVVV